MRLLITKTCNDNGCYWNKELDGIKEMHVNDNEVPQCLYDIAKANQLYDMPQELVISFGDQNTMNVEVYNGYRE